MEESLQEIQDRITNCIILAKTGEYIEDMPFSETTVNGYVYDDEVMRIATGDDGRHLEVFRKSIGNIVLEVSSGIIRRYSHGDMDCLIPHLMSALSK